MRHSRLNAYHIVWLFVFFDLPTDTKKKRKAYSDFRKKLQKDGFTMHQYSVYSRHCASRESAEVHTKRIHKNIPIEGHISILSVTDKQYEKIINYWGKASKPLAPTPNQLELF